MASNSIKMKVWPGPRVMVPLATDVLLVGKNDLPQEGHEDSTGTALVSNKIKYWDLFLRNTLGTIEPELFSVVSRSDHLQPGAHIMWTLPYALRKGKQVDGVDNDGDVAFPLVPNRWLVTRLEYKSITDGSIPTIISHVVKSDVISDGGPPPAPQSKSQYPFNANNFPVNTIGESVPLDQWDGDLPPENTSVELKAAGPAALSWSVTYDNVREVFGFYDDSLSENASSNTPYYYTYSIIGWYIDPDNDVLIDLPTTDNTAWQAQIQNEFMWTVGESDTDVENAVEAWTKWQADHGLTGVFDPSKLNLPEQSKKAIEAWHTWQQANGEINEQPDLAKQLLCHSMVGMVKWEGETIAYGSGVPLGTRELPTIAMGNNSVEAIATYMAHEIVNNPGNPQPPSDIPLIARSLEAFQKDLLYDYQKDPIKVENQLHDARFTISPAGIEWIVVRAESDTDDPSTKAGRQSIPLNEEQTQALTDLNTLQSTLNALNNTIASQRNELFMLNYKLYVISIQRTNPIPQCVQDKVLQSFDALKAELQKNIDQQTSETSTITDKTTALSNLLGADFILKSAELPGFAAPNDPVIMVAGADLDTKLSASSVNMNFEMLDVRYTGQFITQLEVSYDFQGTSESFPINATDLLDEITFPSWKAFPKEVMDLWVETLLLDLSTASIIAIIYFDKRGISESTYTAKTQNGGTESPLEELTKIIQTNQSKIYNDADELQIPKAALVAAAGFLGIPPAHAAIAFRTKQPWTPIFMDWKVKWFPNSLDSTTPLEDWELAELDYLWEGKNISDENALTFSGRSVLNPSIAQNIQLKLSTFKDDPNYDDLPDFIKDDLEYAAGRIKNLDILTQSISGFTEQLITKTLLASSPFENNDPEDINSLLKGANESFAPELSTTDCPCTNPNSSGSPQTYSPIRSGHFQLLNVWIVDSFGQIMFGRDLPIGSPDNTPMTTVQWSESLLTPDNSENGSGLTLEKFGQLPPRLSQAAKANLDLLQNDDDNIISNSADSTSPICGWVMANHLDNSLMVFDQKGNSKGAIIKVQSEDTATKESIRWDATPGLNTTLGAPPDLEENEHLAGFVNGLLETGFEGANAFDDFMASIDSALWTLSNYANKDGNLSILLGRPLAVVRAQVSLNISGDPSYKQNWCDTGKYYNDDGTYKPSLPPYLSVPFSLRVGDAYLIENGVMGYFEADQYNTFYPVYGIDGQTQTYINIIRAGQTLRALPPISTGGYTSSYVEAGHTVGLEANGTPVKLTVLVDPVGDIPIFPGSLPFSSKVLPNGPVAEALSNLKASFRAGPLLLDPSKIKMPSPSEIKGKWAWMARENVTTWNEETPIEPFTPLGTLPKKPVRLIEGWLNLSDFNEK